MTRKSDKLDALVFIDTNIFLDFYRIRTGGVGLELLKLIEKHKSILITSSQVEMEYKKNRQAVVLESLKSLKLPDWNGLSSPAFLIKAKPAEMIERHKRSIKEQHKKLKGRVASILEKPNINDPVFKTLTQLFKESNTYNLGRENDLRHQIRELAEKRFKLGYPPRKKDDTSMGDAINWEWIVFCAKTYSKDIIIVTRDTDYGMQHEGKFFLNDWLSQEFKERVSQKRKIILTDKLSEAFELVGIKIGKKVEEEEAQLIKEITAFIRTQFSELTAGSGTTGTTTENRNLALPSPSG